MGWEFEHWDNGKVYLHNERWDAFKKNLFAHGSYPHNWSHNRVLFQLHSPRDVITEVPAPGDFPEKYKIFETDLAYSTIYEPYPAFVRTNEDPEGWLPSWHIFAEDGHKSPQGEPITILSTSDIYQSNRLSVFLVGGIVKNQFAYFRGKFWRLEHYQNFGIGPNPPPSPSQKKRKKLGRSLNDPFEQSW